VTVKSFLAEASQKAFNQCWKIPWNAVLKSNERFERHRKSSLYTVRKGQEWFWFKVNIHGLFRVYSLKPGCKWICPEKSVHIYFESESQRYIYGISLSLSNSMGKNLIENFSDPDRIRSGSDRIRIPNTIVMGTQHWFNVLFSNLQLNFVLLLQTRKLFKYKILHETTVLLNTLTWTEAFWRYGFLPL
jgi:hypothetical protein